LTTIGQPTIRMALTAVEILIRILTGNDAGVRNVVLQPTLIIRGSTTQNKEHQGTH
jgi:DNA-binding LacI/PurR family transcriptional regulator